MHVTGNGAGSVDLTGFSRRPDHGLTGDHRPAGNTASGSGDTLTLDTTADVGADLAVSVSDHLVNNSEQLTEAFTVAGLDSDATADVTFTDGSSNTVVMHVTGNGAGSADLTGLADGPITVSIEATDTAGNTASGSGDTLTLDTTADVGADLAVSVSDHLVNNSEQLTEAFTVAGLDSDATADVTFTDGSSNTVVMHVTGNGAGSADLTGLADGPITVSIEATDTAGNTASGSGDTLTLDTTADVGADLAVSVSDHLVNNSEQLTEAFTVAGLDSDATADVTFTDGSSNTVVMHVTGNGAGSADLTGLADGPITVSIEATDTAGNTASGSGDTLTLDTTADVGADLAVSVSDHLVNNSEQLTEAFTVAGLDSDATADVTFTDGSSNTVVMHVTGNGAGSADLTGLADGPITVSIEATDTAGNTASGSGDTLTLDTTADVGADLAVSVSDHLVNNSEQLTEAFTVAGLDSDATADVTFTDGSSNTVVMHVTGNGAGSADLTGLADGPITVSIEATDTAGNTASGSGDTLTLDTTADVGADLAVSVSDHLVNNSEQLTEAFTVAGLDSDATADVTFTDGSSNTVVMHVTGNGAGSADLTGLADGPITVSIEATDTAGNTASGSGDTLTLDTTADVGADLAVSVSDHLVNNSEQLTEAFTVAGLDSDATADVTFTDGSSNTVVMHVTGNGAGSADLTGLADGPITVSIEATDTAGNTASGSGDTLTLDTTADVGADLAVSVSDHLVNNSEQLTEAFTVAGLDSDATADVTFTDGSSNTVVMHVTGNGAGSADLTGLADGPITVSIEATDTAGNTASGSGDTLTLDTTADVGADLAVSVSDHLVNNSEQLTEAFTVAGLDSDATADVTFTDGSSNTVVMHVTGNGAGSADLTGLADGPITVSIEATDTAGNTASGSGDTLTLDTTADVGADLAVSVSDHLVNNSEQLTEAFTVAGLDSDATADVTFTDGSSNTVVMHVTGNGAGSADLTGLADGPITVSIEATDTAGNTASGSGDTLTLDTTADGAPTSRSVSDHLVNNSEQLTGPSRLPGWTATPRRTRPSPTTPAIRLSCT